MLESLFSGDDRKRLLHFTLSHIKIMIMILQGDYLGNGSGEQLPALCNRKELKTSCYDLFAYTTFICSVLESFNRKVKEVQLKLNFIHRLSKLQYGRRGYSYYDDGTGAGGIYVNGYAPSR